MDSIKIGMLPPYQCEIRSKIFGMTKSINNRGTCSRAVRLRETKTSCRKRIAENKSEYIFLSAMVLLSVLAGNRMFIALAVNSGCQPSRRPRRVVDLPSKLCRLFRKVPAPLTVILTGPELVIFSFQLAISGYAVPTFNSFV